MTKRVKTRETRPATLHQSSPMSERSDSLAGPQASEPAAGGVASGTNGHDFGRVSIYPSEQRPLPPSLAAEAAPGPDVAGIAASGIRGSSHDYPFREQIEASLGRPIPAQAHTDHHAADAADALGASAFTAAGHVAFATSSPTLETAAHEAAHAIQQREGVASFTGLNQAGDAFERQADQVAEAVVAGKRAAPILGKSRSLPGGVTSVGPVQLQKKKGDTSFVGGTEGTGLQGPDDTKYVQPGEGFYAQTLQGATTYFAGDFKDEAARMKPVVPQLGKVDRAVAIAIHERDYYKSQKSGFAPASVNKSWQEKVDYADKKATDYTEDKRREQANFHSYNAFVPLGNSLIQQIERIEAQKYMLGVKDDTAMVAALVQGMDDARKVGHRAQESYAKKKDHERVEAPSATISVEAAAQKVRVAAAELDGKYLEFQAAVTLDQEATALKELGKDEQKRLDEINEIKTFLKDVGKTVDFTQKLVKEAPEKIANYVEKPSSILPGAEKAAEVITDFIYYAEVQKLTSKLDTLNGMIEKKKLVKEFAHVSSVSKLYRAALLQFAEAATDLQRALHQRRHDYMMMGVSLDRFAQGDPVSQKEGVAPKQGGDRYATMMALAVELRQSVALARFVKDGMPPLEGGTGAKTGLKAPPWQAWAVELIERRASYASWHPHPTPFDMPEAEAEALKQAWLSLNSSDLICSETIKRYGPVDKSADELMAALGGMQGV